MKKLLLLEALALFGLTTACLGYTIEIKKIENAKRKLTQVHIHGADTEKEVKHNNGKTLTKGRNNYQKISTRPLKINTEYPWLKIDSRIKGRRTALTRKGGSWHETTESIGQIIYDNSKKQDLLIEINLVTEKTKTGKITYPEITVTPQE